VSVSFFSTSIGVAALAEEASRGTQVVSCKYAVLLSISPIPGAGNRYRDGRGGCGRRQPAVAAGAACCSRIDSPTFSFPGSLLRVRCACPPQLARKRKTSSAAPNSRAQSAGASTRTFGRGPKRRVRRPALQFSHGPSHCIRNRLLASRAHLPAKRRSRLAVPIVERELDSVFSESSSARYAMGARQPEPGADAGPRSFVVFRPAKPILSAGNRRPRRA
jgi:hypothetical protein